MDKLSSLKESYAERFESKKDDYGSFEEKIERDEESAGYVSKRIEESYKFQEGMYKNLMESQRLLQQYRSTLDTFINNSQDDRKKIDSLKVLLSEQRKDLFLSRETKMQVLNVKKSKKTRSALEKVFQWD